MTGQGLLTSSCPLAVTPQAACRTISGLAPANLSASGLPPVNSPASRELASARAVFPGPASLKPANRRPRPVCPPLHQRVRAPHPWHPPHQPRPRSLALAHPLYSYPLKRHAASRQRYSFAPGRDMLCILTSPPRWLQWP
jgi:hypothetical protein